MRTDEPGLREIEERRQRRLRLRARRKARRRGVLLFVALIAIVVVAVVITGERSGGASARERKQVAPAPANPFKSRALRTYLTQRTGDIGAAIYNVATGATYLYRAGAPQQTASIMKADILATLLHQTQNSGGLTDAEEDLAVPMIQISDNDDAQDLWDEEGGAPAVLAFDQAAGMTQTTPNAAGYWGLSWTTARDQLRLLRQLFLPSSLLQRSSQEYEYGLMRNIAAGEQWGISGGVPPTATVALKNGWLPNNNGIWQVNSIGSVVGSGRHYLIAVLTNGDPTENYGITTIQQIAATAWQVLG